MFVRLGAFCFRRRWLVVGVWLVAIIGVNVVSNLVVGTDFRSQFDLPGESKTGFDIIDDEFSGLGNGATGQIVVSTDRGVDDPDVREALEAYFDDVAEVEGVAAVTSPYSDMGAATQVSDDGEIAYANVEIPYEADQSEWQSVTDDVKDLTPEIDGLRIELGGDVFSEFEPPSSETLGLAFAIVILILAFGSVLAMGLPIGVALGGIGAGTALLGLLSQVTALPEFAITLGLMIGLGVGIDYALFIVTRYREQLHRGHSVAESISIALDTAGRAVIFAGTTVVISLLGMLLMGIRFVSGLGMGAALVVLVTMAASLTLLPALLALAGERVEVTRWRGLIAAGLVAVGLLCLGFKLDPVGLAFVLAAVVVIVLGFFVPVLQREAPRRAPKPARETAAYRWSRVVQHHPWSTALAAAAVLLVLAIPMLSLRLGFSDHGNDPEGTSAREAYDLLADGFGPGSNGPLILVTRIPEATAETDFAAVADVTAAIEDTEGVASVMAIPNDFEAPTAVLWNVIPTTAPQDAATTDLLEALRGDVVPDATTGTGMEVAATGTVAVNVDFSHHLASRLPLFFGVVLAVSFLFLMAVFRSLLVPLKAVIMNLLSIGAAYGIVVAVFQWGWGAGVLGLAGAPIEPFIPMMLFAIVFGLSMDYEVFLLSRVKEEWLRTGDSRTSVADGLAATARVITAAAAIMVFVFGSFLFEPIRVIRLFGFGLAVAILLDATIVRLVLVPATMELLGDKNWWLPRWLDRILPNIDVEGRVDHAEAAPAPDTEIDLDRSPDGADRGRREVSVGIGGAIDLDGGDEPDSPVRVGHEHA